MAIVDRDNTWCVYIVRCADNSMYTGVAINVERRMLKHLSGRGAKYLRPACRQPFQAVVSATCKDKPEALRFEAAIKRLTAAQKHQLVEAWQALPSKPAGNDLFALSKPLLEWSERRNDCVVGGPG